MVLIKIRTVVPIYYNHGKEATQEHDKILITTRDKPDGGIDSEEILNIIKAVIKGE